MARTQGAVEDADRKLMRQLGLLVPLWTLAFLLASLGLLTYGDVLMNLFT